GTHTAVNSPARCSFARLAASRRSVLTRSPIRFGISDDATTMHSDASNYSVLSSGWGRIACWLPYSVWNRAGGLGFGDHSLVGIAVPASCRRGLPIEPGQPGEVVGEIGQADFDAGAHHADGANDEPEPAFLSGKDVLDPSPHPGAGRVAARDVA